MYPLWSGTRKYLNFIVGARGEDEQGEKKIKMR
jgi:hypothetical protein